MRVDVACAPRDHRVVDHGDIEALEAAVRALNHRELEPLVDLMADDMVWTGQAPRWLWWRDASS